MPDVYQMCLPLTAPSAADCSSDPPAANGQCLITCDLSWLQVEQELAEMDNLHAQLERRGRRMADSLLFLGLVVLVTQFVAFIYLTWWGSCCIPGCIVCQGGGSGV
jgi:hypothetical protein